MASRRPKRQTKRKHPYETDPIGQSSESSNWSIKTLKIELQKLGINVPNGLSKTVLHQLYLENVKPKVVEEVSSGNNNIDMKMTSDQDVSLVRDSTEITTPSVMMNVQSLIEQARAQDPGHTSSTIPLGGNDNQMPSILGALTSVTQCFTGLQDTVNQLLKTSGHTEKVYDVNREKFNLHQWYASNKSCPNDNAFQHVQTAQGDLHSNQGVRSDSFTNVDIISPNLQKDILEGKDINLATLLIPFYDCPTKHSVVANGIEVNVTGKPDIRLNRRLSIQEFIRAFGKYKRVMTSVFVDRRTELDAYEDDIIDIHNFFGEKFYDYHKAFSAKSAVLLRTKKVKVDWGKRDRDLLSLISAGTHINTCRLCNMVDHTTQFCPLQTSKSYIGAPIDDKSRNERSDRYGRPRSFHDGKEICNNFNGSKGCTRANCTFAHVCARCRIGGHPQMNCRKNTNQVSMPTSTTTSEKPSTSK